MDCGVHILFVQITNSHIMILNTKLGKSNHSIVNFLFTYTFWFHGFIFFLKHLVWNGRLWSFVDVWFISFTIWAYHRMWFSRWRNKVDNRSTPPPWYVFLNTFSALYVNDNFLEPLSNMRQLRVDSENFAKNGITRNVWNKSTLLNGKDELYPGM